jgi:hypothetical protein
MEKSCGQSKKGEQRRATGRHSKEVIMNLLEGSNRTGAGLAAALPALLEEYKQNIVATTI